MKATPSHPNLSLRPQISRLRLFRKMLYNNRISGAMFIERPYTTPRQRNRPTTSIATTTLPWSSRNALLTLFSAYETRVSCTSNCALVFLFFSIVEQSKCYFSYLCVLFGPWNVWYLRIQQIIAILKRRVRKYLLAHPTRQVTDGWRRLQIGILIWNYQICSVAERANITIYI